MKKILNLLQNIILALIISAFNYSCDSRNEDGLITNTSVNINSFIVNGINGTIDNKTDKITVAMPYGTNITSLVPQIDIPEGATVIPASGQAINFTQSVKFRVKNGNIYKDYEVNVKAQNPIISFKNF